MFIHKKGQSLSEYAITLGLVVAVVAGILSTTVKGGMRHKQQQAMKYLIDAGNDDLPSYDDAFATDIPLYSEEYRKTDVLGGSNFVDESVLKKGGLENKFQKQTTATTAVSIEKLDPTDQAQ